VFLLVRQAIESLKKEKQTAVETRLSGNSRGIIQAVVKVQFI
jgi:hypothetical protein